MFNSSNLSHNCFANADPFFLNGGPSNVFYSIFTFGQLFVYKMKMTVEFCRQHTLYASACKMSPDQCAVTDYCGRRRLVDHILRKNCFYFFGQQQTLLWLLWIVESIIICLMWPKNFKKAQLHSDSSATKKVHFRCSKFHCTIRQCDSWSKSQKTTKIIFISALLGKNVSICWQVIWYLNQSRCRQTWDEGKTLLL